MAANVHDPSLDPPVLPTFVLSGGGNLGALQVGMVYALVESGIRPGKIVGTSVGALNGGFLASRSDLNGIGEIAQFWSVLRRKDVLSINARSIARGALGLDGYFFNSKPMRRIVESFLAFDRLEKAPIPFAVVATALTTGEPVILESGDAAEALLASSAIPRVLPPVEIDGRLLVDGAVAADIPLHQALLLGAKVVYVLPTAPAQVAKIRQQSLPFGADAAGLHIVTPPDVHVPLGDLTQTRRLLLLGYEHARAWLEGDPFVEDSRSVSRRKSGRYRRDCTNCTKHLTRSRIYGGWNAEALPAISNIKTDAFKNTSDGVLNGLVSDAD